MNEFKNNYVCPRCKSNLTIDGTNFKCSDNTCIYSTEKFLTIDHKPVLVDFNNSVLNQDVFIKLGGGSIVERESNPSFIYSFLQKLLHGSGSITKKNLEYLNSELNSDSKILIIGGGTIGSGMHKFIQQNKGKIISFDIYNSTNINFIADAHSIPITDETFDLVIIQAVLEHVVCPQIVVNEIRRVLKINGKVYAETPFLQHVHEGAYDFTRYTVLGHRILFKDFDTNLSGFNGGIGTKILWSIEMLFSGLFRSRRIGKIFRVFFFYFRFIDNLIDDHYNEDGACGVFFIGTKTTKISHETYDYKKYILEYNGSQI
jgi:SAM-dependent methyltransferase